MFVSSRPTKAGHELICRKYADASYSWSANVLGCKRWHFVRPSQIAMCREDASDPTSPLCQDPRDVVNENLRVVTVEQPENSVIFV